MCHELLRDARFFAALLVFDRDLATEFRRTRSCVVCGGRFHSAKYRRKPRGGPAISDEDYKKRFSYCCANCKKRATPPSLRFLGARVYVGAVVILVSALVHGLTEKRLADLREQVSPTLSAMTIRRWQSWWRDKFPATPFWKSAKSRFASPAAGADLPASLLARFRGDDRERLLAVLRFLSPIATSTAMAG